MEELFSLTHHFIVKIYNTINGMYIFHLHLGFLSGLFPSVFPTELQYVFLLTLVIPMCF